MTAELTTTYYDSRLQDGRGVAFVRQWRILKLISSNNYVTLDILASGLHVSKKTIRRDMAMLELVGIPIYVVRDDSTHYFRVNKGWFWSEPAKR